MRILIGVVYWTNAIASIPASVAGLWFGLNVISAQDDWLIGIVACAQVVIGWGLLFGYHLAFFKNRASFNYKVFWKMSTVLNLGFAILWTVLAYQSDNVMSGILLGGWPFGIALLSGVVLRGHCLSNTSTS